MSFAFLRFFALASVCVFVMAGCGAGSGGNGGGGGGNPTTIAFNFRQPMPTAVAAKIGSGTFAAQTLNSGKLSLSIPSGTSDFAVAYVCPVFNPGPGSPTSTYQYVVETSTADGTSFTPPACVHFPSADPSGTLTGTVDASAIAGASAITIDAESGSSYMEDGPIAPGNFSFSAPAGTNRVEVLAYEKTQWTNYGDLSLVAARNFGSQSVPGQLNGGNPVILGATDATTMQPISYAGVPSGFSSPMALVLVDMGAEEFLVSSATNQYPAVPSTAMESGDFYDFIATSLSTGGQLVAAETTTSGGNALAITFPTPWSYAGPTVAALPTFNFDYTGFSGKTGILQSGIIEWSTSSTAQSWYQVSATANYQSGSTALAMPDLSGLTGFLAAPGSGAPVVWAAEITQQNVSAFQPLTANTTINVVENAGVYEIP